MNTQILFYFVAVLVVATSLYLALATPVIRDSSLQGTTSQTPFSLARTQLLWWTTIIIFCYAWNYGRTGKTPELAPEYLWLLGISVSTTLAGSVIDRTEISQGLVRHQDNASQGFFHDILSDENGVSIHRYQNVIFNVIFGLIVIVQFFKESVLHSFSDNELILLGISSTAFVTIKANENKPATLAPAVAEAMNVVAAAPIHAAAAAVAAQDAVVAAVAATDAAATATNAANKATDTATNGSGH